MKVEIPEDLRQKIREIAVYQGLHFEFLSLRDGECRVRVPRNPKFDGVFNSYHGGLLMTVADSAACMAILSLTGVKERITTTDMNIRFLAPCFTPVVATATVIKLGRTLCPVAVDLEDEGGVRVALAQVNYLRLGSGQ